MTTIQLLLAVGIYVLSVRACLAWTAGQVRSIVFALLNLLGVVVLLYPAADFAAPYRLAVALAVYFGLVVFQYLMLRRYVGAAGWRPWLAFFAPLAGLVAIKYVLPLLEWLWPHSIWSHLKGRHGERAEVFFIGLSYLAFRASYLVLEVRNGLIKSPGFWDYLGFCFFVPTMSVGPINHFSHFQAGFSGPDRTALPLGRCAMRVLVGCVKFLFLAHPCGQLAYDGLMLDGHPHHWPDLITAAVFYYFYLYCNFSGFCDIAIGVAGLLGFPVEENFRDPFAARNIQEFWNRWHITLSRYMRDVAFTPLSKWLVGLFGVAFSNFAIALSVFTVFLVMGAWHGLGWNYVAFGAAHGLGVVAVQYYAVGLKRWLGKEGYRRYVQNGWVRALAVALTFSYVTASFFLFANDFPTMRRILAAII